MSETLALRQKEVVSELTGEIENKKRNTLIELNRRETAGCNIALLWNQLDNGLFVTVEVTKTRFSAMLSGNLGKGSTPAEQAIDVFDHPFAYAAQTGRDTEKAFEIPIADAA